MGNQLSAQDNRRVGRALVCGALLVYGCLRIPAAAQSAAEPQAQELQKFQQEVCQLEAPEQQSRDELGGPALSPGCRGVNDWFLALADAAPYVMSSASPRQTSPE